MTRGEIAVMANKFTYRPEKELPAGLVRWILGIISSCRGANNAVSREQINSILARYHNMEVDDRTLRRVVEKIRRMGVRLCDLEDGSGLFIAATEQEYSTFKLRYGSHAFSLMRTIRAMDEGCSVDELTGDDTQVKPTQMQLI